ncbi:hypothetical protein METBISCDRAFT_15283 [Metschnikowia bicuspidata]|uniref:PHD-type domain-containing protein n=1 Tax=Metschnikowia bicuspidata TaxID=27322 RepID=A0A4P9ZD90_9ASCO|nr:hypothetical protein METBISCDRAFT_15283 [Metschnikowia bicuspidata]
MAFPDTGTADALGFVEPELAVPRPGISGYTLESLPPVKQKRTVRRNKLALGSRLSPEADPGTHYERELAYQASLKTPELEQLTGVSELPRKKLTILIPSTPREILPRLETTPGRRASKKIKIISPKRLPLLLAPPSDEPSLDAESANNNDDFCSTCGGTGIFICCDLCPKSFHLLCCAPPLLEVPDKDDWNCRECRAASGIDPKPAWNLIGIFGLLLNDLHGSNPNEFCLPKGLRESTFINVYLGEDSQYVDLLLKKESPTQNGPKSGAGGSHMAGFNRNGDLDIESLYDKNGAPHLCHKCGLSGLNRRTLIFCDYCPLVWHLDCLPSAVCVPKTLGLKWRCPNHVESIIPSYWLERRSFKESVVVDSGAQSNFLRYLLASNFLIKFSDQPHLNDGYAPLLAEYLDYQRDDFISNRSNHIANNGAGASKTDEPDVDPNVKPPPFLQSFGVHEGVVAKSSQKLARVLVVSNGDAPKEFPFIYRIPEQQIVLDFVNKSKRNILEQLQQYEDKAAQEQEDEQAVLGLLLLKGACVKVEANGASEAGVAPANSSPHETQKEELPEHDLAILRRLTSSIGKEKLLSLVSAI